MTDKSFGTHTHMTDKGLGTHVRAKTKERRTPTPFLERGRISVGFPVVEAMKNRRSFLIREVQKSRRTTTVANLVTRLPDLVSWEGLLVTEILI